MRACLAVLLLACLVALGGRGYAESPTGQTCQKAALYDASASGVTQLVAAGQTVFVCGYTFELAGTATSVGLVYGSGTNCAAGQTAITPTWTLASAGSSIVDGAALFRGIDAPSGNALCLSTSTAQHVQGIVYYSQGAS
jgi:hypothetical protein